MPYQLVSTVSFGQIHMGSYVTTALFTNDGLSDGTYCYAIAF
jgi:hypothetical protein